MHRDLFSAYLSRYVNQDDRLSLQDAASQYLRSEPTLLDAWQESINRKQVGSSESRLITLERLSNEMLMSDQIANKGEKSEQDALSGEQIA